MNLFQEFEERKIDYDKVWRTCRNKSTNHEKVDVSIIIPVHGRTQFNHIISDAFAEAIKNIDKKVSLTIVEHSKEPEHESLCRDWVNYIWIPQGEDRFNKCLCFNMGVLLSVMADYYLFHDGDILVQESFFIDLMKNMEGYDAVQSFARQRLIHCEPFITNQILNKEIEIEKLQIGYPGCKAAQPGAEGGSIFCKKELIEQGCIFPDWGFDEYSVEDSFFFRSLQLIGKVGFCNDPEINLFHLWHSPSFSRQTKKCDWDRYYAFMAMNEEGKRHLIKLQSEHFNKYYAS